MNNKFKKFDVNRLKKVNQTFIDNADHCGMTVNELYTEMIKNASLVESGLVRIIDSAKSKVIIPTFESNAYLGPVSCDGLDFPSTASPLNDNLNNHTIAYRQMDMCEFSYVDKLCKNEYVDLFDEKGIFEAFQGANNFEIQSAIMNVYMKEVTARISFQMEQAWLNGDTTIVADGYNYNLIACDGILKKMKNDVNVIHVDGYLTPGAALSASNIIAELQKIYNAIPDDMLFNHGDATGDDALYMAVSPSAMRFIQQAYSATSGYFLTNRALGALIDPDTASIISNLNINSTGASFYGIPIVVIRSMPANTIFVSYARNIVYGTDTLSDYLSLDVIPEYLYDSKKISIGIRMLFRLGNQYVFPGEVIHRY